MIGIHVQDHRNRRIHLQIVILEFTRLADHGIGFSDTSVGVYCRKSSADKQRRIHPGLQTDLREHGSGCGFAMRPCDRNCVGIAAGNHTQNLCPLDKRNVFVFRREQLWVFPIDRCGVYHQISTLHVCRIVTDVDRNAQPAQTVDIVRLVDVRTGDRITQRMQDFRHRTHAGTAYADKMDMLDRIQNIFHMFLPEIELPHNTAARLLFLYYIARFRKRKHLFRKTRGKISLFSLFA